MVQNGKPVGNMVIKLGLDSTAFSSSLAGAQRATKSSVKEMTSMFKIADNGGDKLKALSVKQEGLTKVIKAQKNEVSELKKAYEKTLDEQGNATSKTAKAAQKYNEAQTKLSGYERELGVTAGQLARLKVETEGVTGQMNRWSGALIAHGEKVQKFGASVSALGSKLTTGLTLPIAAGVAAVTNAAVSWESAFTGVKKTNDEIVDSNGKVTYSYADLEKGLRGLAKTLPTSHEDIAAVAEAAGQLGIQTDKVVAFTKVMVDMGESTNLSAETAATEMAKFANITGMSQDKFSNLGSALVELGNNFATTESDISAMALRLAGAGSQIGMSEGDIVGLSAALSSVGIEAEAGGSAFSKVMVNMQLAVENGIGSFDDLIAQGGAVGASLSDISSAVQHGGKELTGMAKKMGLSTTQLKSMYKEADTAASTLVNFSDVAGVTNAEFADLFKKSPAEAIQKFITGLGHTEEHGKSAIKVLNDMDIKEVRLRDSLLRAANASGVFGKAIETGNKAFNKNSALTNEANKRYETTASKVKALKNEVKDAAIDLGGPFVDALRGGVKAAKPMIEGLAKMAKQFNSLSDEEKQNALKWLAVAAAAGPALKLIGGGISIVGGAEKGIGKLGKKLVEFTAAAAEKKAIASATGGIAELGGAATAAAGVGAGATGTGLGAVVSALGAIAAPAAIAVGAIVVTGAALYEAKKKYDEWQLTGAKWGTSVTAEQDKALEKAKELKDDGVTAIQDYQDGVTTSSEAIVKANKAITKSIQDNIDKEYERKRKNAKGIKDDDTRAAAEKQAERDKKVKEQEVERAKVSATRINEIATRASKEKRAMTADEIAVINGLYGTMNKNQISGIMDNKKAAEALEIGYQKDITKGTTGELIQRRDKVKSALGDMAKDYEDQQGRIRKAFKNNPQEMEKRLTELDGTYKASTANMVASLGKLYQATGGSLENQESFWASLGYTVQDVEDLIDKSTDTTTQNLDMFAKGTSEVDNAWNQLALDPKTGEIKSNMADTLADMAKTDEGWTDLIFMAKNADITTNAKEEIAIALGQAKKWDLMSMEQKEAVIDGDKAKLAMYELIDDAGLWNNYNLDRKQMGVDNADAIWKLLDTEEKVNQWNSIKPEDKKLLANDQDFLMKLTTSKVALDEWGALPDSTKKMFADNTDLQNKVFASKESYNAWTSLPDNVKNMLASNEDLTAKLQDGTLDLATYDQIKPALKLLLGDSSGVDSATAIGNENLNGFAANNPGEKQLTGNVSSVTQATTSGNAALNTFERNNPLAKTLKANDEASAKARKANQEVGDFDRQPDTITKTIRVVGSIADNIKKVFGWQKGTSYHPGGMAIVNDQRGPLYKELVRLPNGKAFIPQDRNTMLDLPKGSQVLKASLTKRMFPQYADGIGIPENSKMVRNLRQVGEQSTTVQADFTDYSGKLDKLINIMQQFSYDLANMQMVVDKRVFGELVTEQQARNKYMDNIIAKMNGGGR